MELGGGIWLVQCSVSLNIIGVGVHVHVPGCGCLSFCVERNGEGWAVHSARSCA
jgi:hypothetical protein